MSTSKEIAAKEQTFTPAVEETKNLPATALEFDDDEAGAGLENADIESFAIPFLQIMQKGTPAVDEDKPQYIPGAKAGMLFNSVTRKCYDGKAGIDIIPVYYERTYIRWGGRKGANPGFKGVLQLEEMDKLKRDPTQVKEIEGKFYAVEKDGTVDVQKSDYFADTRSHFIYIIDPDTGEYSRALFPLTSSQVKSSKILMTLLKEKLVIRKDGKKINPPTYANVIHVTTTALSDNQGNTWSGVEFTPVRLLNGADVELYTAAKQFHNDVKGNTVPVDYSKADYNNGAAEEDETTYDKPKEAKTF
jgi:hypothetical protein